MDKVEKKKKKNENKQKKQQQQQRKQKNKNTLTDEHLNPFGSLEIRRETYEQDIK